MKAKLATLGLLVLASSAISVADSTGQLQGAGCPYAPAATRTPNSDARENILPAKQGRPVQTVRVKNAERKSGRP